LNFRAPLWYRAIGSCARLVLQAAQSPRVGPWPKAPQPTVWIHAASLGESKGSETLAAALPPGVAATFTCTTRAGVDRLRSRGLDCLHLPCDDAASLSDFLDSRKIRRLLLLEAETWPGLLASTAERGIPVAIAAFRGSPRSIARWRRFDRWFPGWTDAVERVWSASTEQESSIASLRFREVLPGHPLKWTGAPPPAGPGDGPDAAISLHLRDLPTLRRLVSSRSGRGWLWFPRHPHTAPIFRLRARMLGLSLTNSVVPEEGMVRISRRLGEVGALLPGCRSAWVSPGHDLEEPSRLGVPETTTGDPPRTVPRPEKGNDLLVEEIVSWLIAS